MSIYILRRILIAIPILLGVTIADFAFINLAPGDPVMAMIDPESGAGPGDIERLREQMGLNQPLPVRYVLWLRELLTGNFGYSLIHHRPVLDRILERLGPTLTLTLAALVISVLIGIPLGIYSALRQYSLGDYVLTVAAFTGDSLPSFFLALGAIYLFSLKLNLLPPFGMASVGEPFSIGDRLRYLVLPATVLGISSAASLMRYTRTSMLEVLNMDYITTARAKGLWEHLVIIRHALRNALIPVITILGLRIPSLFSGAVLIETVFSWPGIGQLSISAINERDYPQIMGLLLISAILILLANLIADIAYAAVDPRIQYDDQSA